MAWVAVDRSVDLLERFGDPQSKDMIPGLRALRERIHEDVCQRRFHSSVNAFTQYYGGDTLDASVLRIPWVGFLPATDPRMKGTVAAVEKTLLRDGFMQRYSTEHGVDGLAGSEGAFLACSFWLVDNYALAGRIDEAEKLMDRLLALRTPLGLLSEEYEPSRRRLIGNFPQAFSHLALICSARVLSTAREAASGRAKKRATQQPEMAGVTHR